MQPRRVVVTGLGVVTSLSRQVDDLWQRICQGESGIGPITVFDASAFPVRFAGEVRDWSTEGYLPNKEAKRLDRFCQFAMVAGIDAVRDADIRFEQLDAYRCGVIVGSGIGGLNEIETQHERLLTKGPERVSAFTIPKLMVNAAAGQLSIHFGLRGPNAAVASACASASHAIGEAFQAIRYGEAEVMLTGGSEAALTPMGIAGFAKMRALSERNDEPTRASRPFDKDRDGFVLAEGAAVLVLEELEFAKARGAKIYAELVGYGASADAGHITQPDQTGQGPSHAMQRAIRDAGVEPQQMDYINAHGTATPLGDVAETNAIKRVFGDHAYRLNVSSTKSQLGHLLGASGAVEAVLTVLAIHHQTVPPTINLETPDPECDLNYTPLEPVQRPVRVAMSNSFGFGGHNASLVFRAFEA